MEYLPALMHEHVVCEVPCEPHALSWHFLEWSDGNGLLRVPVERSSNELCDFGASHLIQVPETGRSWSLKLEPVPLPPDALAKYRGELARYERHRLQTGEADGRKLWTRLEAAVRELYVDSGLMARAFANASAKLQRQGRRPLVKLSS